MPEAIEKVPEKEPRDIIRLLIVEDEDSQIQLIEDAINDYNRKKGPEVNIEIQCSCVKTFHAATTILLESPFDVSIIDLKLNGSSEEEEGNKLIEIILNNFRFPIIVRTGFSSKVTDKIEQHHLIKVHSKSDNIDEILESIVTVHLSGVTSILATVERYLNDIYWGRISKDVGFWDETFSLNELHEKSLVRYCLLLLQEYLEIENEDSDFSVFHPYEVFIKPPIKANHFFGDILLDETQNNYFIILSPSCDMAQDKYERVTLASIDPFESIEKLSSLLESCTPGSSNTQKSKVKKELKRYLTNNHSNKYHYLPNYHDFPGGLINFQKIYSKSKEELALLSRYASVSNKFSKDIASRFSSYFARQGQPSLDIDDLAERIVNKQ
ncbi:MULTISPECIES: hypothetical protein [Exiguobacterium]|uniref:hypothetical protein n=1 Tax=Exiguobacterium TaxID=33986 RepID=UPI001BEA5284|nr:MULTISPECIES: hypothetical protein [Exiguobacterium]MCT4784017.1 hypothetical protein [Exiguobacterium himgiriensis]